MCVDVYGLRDEKTCVRSCTAKVIKVIKAIQTYLTQEDPDILFGIYKSHFNNYQ